MVVMCSHGRLLALLIFFTRNKGDWIVCKGNEFKNYNTSQYIFECEFHRNDMLLPCLRGLARQAVIKWLERKKCNKKPNKNNI